MYTKCIDSTFKMAYSKFSDRSVETCEAYRRGRTCGSLPLFLYQMVRFYKNEFVFLTENYTRIYNFYGLGLFWLWRNL